MTKILVMRAAAKVRVKEACQHSLKILYEIRSRSGSNL
jgi:hypothetical protein